MIIDEVIKDLEYEVEKCYEKCEGCCSEIENNKCMCSDAIILNYIKKNIEKSKWKSVKDDLPKDEREVLVKLNYTADYEEKYKFAGYSIARHMDMKEEGKYWLDSHYGWLEWDKYSDGYGGCSWYKVIEWKEI